MEYRDFPDTGKYLLNKIVIGYSQAKFLFLMTGLLKSYFGR